jgi:hypothetical protein
LVSASALADELFASAETCKPCHLEIYREWQSSRMAKAFGNPVFQADYGRVKAMAARDASINPSACFRCHAPLAGAASPTEIENSVSREGVTCTVCHSVTRVKSAENRLIMVMDPSGVRYGTHENRPPAPHPVGFSSALGASEFCGSCHLDAVKSKKMGIMPLEWTYREWRDSPYAQQGIQCQNCHMPKVNGKASHRFEGGHSSSGLLSGAATVKMLPLEGDTLTVEVTNAKAGHNLPTMGAHPTELALKIELKDAGGKLLGTEQRIFKLNYLNAAGKPAAQDETVVSLDDKTLRPLEKRTEIFYLSNPKKLHRTKNILASLTYFPLPVSMSNALPAQEYYSNYRPIVIATAQMPLVMTPAKHRNLRK